MLQVLKKTGHFTRNTPERVDRMCNQNSPKEGMSRIPDETAAFNMSWKNESLKEYIKKT